MRVNSEQKKKYPEVYAEKALYMMTINLRLKFRPDIWLTGKIPVLQGEKKFHKIFLCTRHNLYCLSDKFYASGIRYL